MTSLSRCLFDQRVRKTLSLALLCVSVGIADAATIVVNGSDDTIHMGNCTLRAAIASMNGAALQGACANTGAAFGSGDLITFDPSVTSITPNDAAGNSFNINVSDLVISGAVTLRRPGVWTNRFRIFNHNGVGALTLQGLTIEGGATDAASAGGGCIYSAGNVSLQNATVTFCETRGTNSPGGGIYAVGSVTLQNSSLVANRTIGVASPGGGVFARFVETSNAIVASNQTLGQNSNGGGIYTGQGNALALRMLATYLGDNRVLGTFTGVANAGGGAYAFGGAQVGNAFVQANRIDLGNGGGLHITGPATISQTTFDDNSAGAAGGALYLTTSAAAYGIDSSTFSANRTSSTAPNVGLGGAIYNIGQLTISNSTISGNSTGGLGGGIFNNGGSLALQSTIIANSVSQSAASPAPNVDIHNNSSILAVMGTNNLVRVVANVMLPAGTLTSDPLLGALQDNGCFQPVGVAGSNVCAHTMLPSAGSPAISAGNNALAALYDQRGNGFPRVIGSAADIGAIETGAASVGPWAITVQVLPAPTVGNVSCTPNPVPNGQSTTCTALANPGYVFDGFSGACVGATCVLNNVTAAQNVTARFSAIVVSTPATAVPTMNAMAFAALLIALAGLGGARIRRVR